MRVSMVLDERHSESQRTQGLDGVNQMKLESDFLRHPLVEDLADMETISISHDSYNLLKFHGSYQQDDREKRKKGAEKAWQFMLRLKVPSGECPGPLYLVLDDLCERFGQRDLRMTTRQAFQIHGISKANLKHVIRTIMEAGSTTIGGCGDINRNVMAPPVPMVEGAPPAYRRVGAIAAICAELFVPQTEAFSEIWCDGDKLASVQYWKRHLVDAVTGGGTPTVENFAKADELRVDAKMPEWMRAPDGHGVVLDHPVEPIYGDIYLPRKFKIGVTVEGDNSIDVFINDIGIVVKEDLSGANVYVGGGLGRTHGKETTFARARPSWPPSATTATARCARTRASSTSCTRSARTRSARSSRATSADPSRPSPSSRSGATATGWAGTRPATARCSWASTASRAACATTPTAGRSD